jgi:hypothetical protein
MERQNQIIRTGGRPLARGLSDTRLASGRRSIEIFSNVRQTSWDGFLTLVEQELNRLPANAAGPWDGKEVSWKGTVSDMEVLTGKNLIRLVFDMPERTLTIKGQPVVARSLMIFVPMEYENLGAVKKGATVGFKTTIAPIDKNHSSVSAQPGKESNKGFLLVFTRGGTILK